MKSSFRYIENTADHLVNIFLFLTPGGEPRATVTGPLSDVAYPGKERATVTTALPLAKGFALAIRIANRNDIELVVSGDRYLWDHNWGTLVHSNDPAYEGKLGDDMAIALRRFG